MTFITNIIKGIFIGIGGIAPGVSGGTFAMMLGVYDKITDAIGSFYKDFKNKFLFLTSIGIGVCIGTIGFSRVLDVLFSDYEVSTKLVFVGIMLGSLPSLVKISNKQGYKKAYLLSLCLTLFITISFTVLDNQSAAATAGCTLNFVDSIIYGGVIALGSIIPGVSSSILLMYAGVYGAVLHAIATLQLTVLLPMGIGFGLTILILSKCIQYLFQHYFGWSSYMVLGFILGSALGILPTSGYSLSSLIGFILAFLGAYTLLPGNQKISSGVRVLSIKLAKFVDNNKII